MIQTRNQYLQFMLVMLAAWGISWGSQICHGAGRSALWIREKTICSSVMVLVLMYLLCVFLGIPPLDSSATGRWSAAQRWRTVAGRCDGRGVCRCISAR